MLSDRKVYRGFLIGVVLGISGCLDSGDSSSGSSNGSNEEPDSEPQYTADLSVFGPHPETSLKRSISEPKYVALSRVERRKVTSCWGARITNMDLAAAAEELRLDGNVLLSGEPRTVPFGQAADEVFYDQIDKNVNSGWPTAGWGDGMACSVPSG
jgi:hypothetical protein